MILILLAGLCALTVPLTGGRLGRLAELEIKSLWAPLLAVALQVVIVNVHPGGSATLHAVIHVGSYALLAGFLLINAHIRGATVIAAGMALNALAILVNGGVMPASAAAQKLAGLTENAGFNNSAAVAHPHLLWLGDVIPVPGPLANVLSVGDLVIFAGMLVLLHGTCRRSAGLIRLHPVGLE
jgi:hypothetical protein